MVNLACTFTPFSPMGVRGQATYSPKQMGDKGVIIVNMYQQELSALRWAGNATRKIGRKERPIDKTERQNLQYSLRDLIASATAALQSLEECNPPWHTVACFTGQNPTYCEDALEKTSK